MRISIAEDSALLRAGLAELLTGRGHQVVAAVDNAEDLLASVATDVPDVVILDSRMPPTHTNEGIRAALVLRTAHPGVGVLVLSHTWRRATPPSSLPVSPRAPDTCSRAGWRTWARSSRRWRGLPPGKRCSTRKSSANS